MLRKHYFNFTNGEVDYSRSYVENDKGIVKTVKEAHGLDSSVPQSSYVNKPVFFDNSGAKVKVNKSEELIKEDELSRLSEIANNKISKCISEINNGYKNEITKSDTSFLTDKELFSFVIKNPSYSYEEDVQDRFSVISEQFKII